MSLLLTDPQQTIAQIVTYLRKIYSEHTKTTAVVAVSGGIDSALSLTLVTKALSPDQVIPVLLPYADQSTTDSETIIAFNQIPQDRWQKIDIAPVVAAVAEQRGLDLQPNSPQQKLRLGNIMARSRMILLYDVARQHDALVCGTENKSEKYLGYFTRFGDEASDIEPIQHLYKTQVRQLAEYLEVPQQIITKAPSAGLWTDQTDEAELGFTYSDADQVLEQLVDQQIDPAQIQVPGIDSHTVQKVLAQVGANHFKHQVPYVVE